MRNINVVRHTRRTKNGTTTVRKHSRAIVTSKLVNHFRRRYAIKSGITVKDGNYSDPLGTSMAMTESKVGPNGEPINHKILVRSKKIVEAGEKPDTILHHELSHILAREKKIAKLPEYKKLMDAVKTTKTFQGLDGAYAKDTEEIFARIYAQTHTGDTTSNDYLFSPKELRRLAPLMERLLVKCTGTKNSKK